MVTIKKMFVLMYHQILRTSIKWDVRESERRISIMSLEIKKLNQGSVCKLNAQDPLILKYTWNCC